MLCAGVILQKKPSNSIDFNKWVWSEYVYIMLTGASWNFKSLVVQCLEQFAYSTFWWQILTGS